MRNSPPQQRYIGNRHTPVADKEAFLLRSTPESLKRERECEGNSLESLSTEAALGLGQEDNGAGTGSPKRFIRTPLRDITAEMGGSTPPRAIPSPLKPRQMQRVGIDIENIVQSTPAGRGSSPSRPALGQSPLCSNKQNLNGSPAHYKDACSNVAPSEKSTSPAPPSGTPGSRSPLAEIHLKTESIATGFYHSGLRSGEEPERETDAYRIHKYFISAEEYRRKKEKCIESTALQFSTLQLQIPVKHQPRWKLVLDLDHTIVHTVPPSWRQSLEAESSKVGGWEGYHVLSNGWCSKLRPGTSSFLDQVSKICEVTVCTLGTLVYAKEVASLHDPQGIYFGGRVYSQRNLMRHNGQAIKHLAPLNVDVSTTLIVDDLQRVWPHSQDNLIACAPYKFFNDSTGNYHEMPALMHAGDEDSATGPLSRILWVVQQMVHIAQQESERGAHRDVRDLVGQVKKSVLRGVRIFMVGVPKEESASLGLLASSLGAFCHTSLTSRVTHIITPSMSCLAGLGAGIAAKMLVTPSWLTTSAVMYQKQLEGLHVPFSAPLPAPQSADLHAIASCPPAGVTNLSIFEDCGL